MRVLFYVLLGLVIAVGAGILLRYDTGQIVIALSEYSIQTKLSFFVLLSLVLFLLLYSLMRSIVIVLDYPKNYRRRKVFRGHKNQNTILHRVIWN